MNASPDSPVGVLLNALRANVSGRRCFVAATPLDPRVKLADSPLLPGAVISVGGPGPDYHPVRGGALGTLHVVAGPDAGFGVALGPGRHVIGRDAAAAVCLHNSDVSRQHAVIEVAPDGTAVLADAGSQNGTLVDGVPITAPTLLGDGAVARIGPDRLRWAPPGPLAVRAVQADGRLEFDRVFSATPSVPAEELEAPPPAPEPRGLTSLLTTVGGLASGPILYAATYAVTGERSLLMLAPSALGVIMPVTSYVAEGRRRGKDRRAAVKAKQAARGRADELAAEEDRVRHLLAPGPAEVVAMATGARPDLWPRSARSPHGLALRVGVTDQTASIQLRGQPAAGFELPVLHGVPVTLDLRDTGVLGVLGTGEPARALLRWLTIQLATLRSPDDLRLVYLTSGDGQDMRWVRWLPHLDPGGALSVPCLIGNTDASRAARIDELTKLIDGRLSERGASPRAATDGEVVVLLDGALALRNLPGIGDILKRGPEAGVYALCADGRAMAECRGTCEVTGTGVRLVRTPDAREADAVPDGMDAAQAERVARALAPMRDRMPAVVAQAIPYPVRLLDLLGIGVPTAEDILARWRSKRERPIMKVILGADAAGPVTADLEGQGPHTMLAGAPGAGKSVLMQSLITALLLENRPDELNLVLVDFKGGGAFLPFENCPHVTAVIKNVGTSVADTFSAADANRMLDSVTEEVLRRQRLLQNFNAEINDYWRARESDPSLARLPRVVFIFDEFAQLLEVSPDVPRALVSVARTGRSLGVHLVFATQAMQGKLTPEMKNNIDLRISLRQNEPAESTEVLGAPDAVTIPGSLRGRGMIVFTKGHPRTPHLFQSGYLGNPPPAASGGPVAVRALRWADLGAEPPAPALTGRGGPTDQELVIRAIEEAARRLAVPPPYRALLPALPASLPLERLADLQTVAPPARSVPFGLADHPDQQAQPAYCLDFTDGNRLMVAGGPQSGRTTFARAFITSLATRFRPDEVHLYVVEHQPAGLAEYSALPHCGGVFSPAEPDRIRRFVGWLAAEAERRAAARFDSGPADNPLIVLVVDGWEQFESRANPALADVSLGPTLREVMAAGPPLGVHVVVTGGKDLLSNKVSGLCDRRLLLPFPNEDDRRSQLRGGMTLPPPLRGRAIDTSGRERAGKEGRHVQICQPVTLAADLVAGVTASYAGAAPDPARLPRRFSSLPALIGVEELALPSPLPSPSWIPLGVGGPEVATVGIDLFDAGPHVMLISGPQKSGRTTAIAALARLLSWHGIDVLTLTAPRSPLGELLAGQEGIRVLSAATFDDAELRSAVEPFGGHRYAVLVDDADRITVQAEKKGYSESATLPEEIARPAELGHRALILAGDATPILAGNRKSFAKPATEALNTGIRLLLMPTRRPDARLLNLSLEPDQYFTRPAGRGYLATPGAATLIQLVATT